MHNLNEQASWLFAAQLDKALRGHEASTIANSPFVL